MMAGVCLFCWFVCKFLCIVIAFLIALQWKCENLLGEKQPKFTETSTPLDSFSAPFQTIQNIHKYHIQLKTHSIGHQILWHICILKYLTNTIQRIQVILYVNLYEMIVPVEDNFWFCSVFSSIFTIVIYKWKSGNVTNNCPQQVLSSIFFSKKILTTICKLSKWIPTNLTD